MLALSQMTDFDKRSSNSSCSSSTPLLNNPSSNAMPLVDNARPWIPALHQQHQQQYTAGYYPSFQQQQQQQQEYYNCPFTASQWAELEQQALIFRYMMAKAPVPAELVNPIRRRLLSGPQNLLGGFHPGLGYSPLDLEPGRCRRTDGKKWRCSRPIVPEQKYCERHVNRGRNRSKKAKEAATAAAAAAAAANMASQSCTPDHGSLKLISQHQLLFQSSNNDQGRFLEPVSPKTTTSPLRQFFDDEQRPATKNADRASSPLDLSLLDATTRIGLASSQPPPPSPAPLPDEDDKRHLVSGAANSPTAVLQRAACTSDCSSSGASSPTASASVK